MSKAEEKKLDEEDLNEWVKVESPIEIEAAQDEKKEK